jgi:hemoglobin
VSNTTKMNLKDITNRADIENVLNAFYKKVFTDPVIGHFFTIIVPLDLEKHIPLITDFWESIIFNTQNYRKNVMEIHHNINRQSSIKKEHLDRWVEIFSQTIDEFHEGDKARLMKQRARSVATLMEIKFGPK